MSEANDEIKSGYLLSGFNSQDSELVISDVLGDSTVRPPRPQLLQLGLAEREKIARWQKAREQDDDVTASKEKGSSPR